ncbi:MAG: BrnT family toxin [Bacteroidota bacterium]
MSYVFEWDDDKSASNIAKHGISFTEATTVFYDTLAIEIDDPAHSTDEIRTIMMGMSSNGKLLVVVYTERRNKYRIISARRATNHERKYYEEAEF